MTPTDHSRKLVKLIKILALALNLLPNLSADSVPSRRLTARAATRPATQPTRSASLTGGASALSASHRVAPPGRGRGADGGAYIRKHGMMTDDDRCIHFCARADRRCQEFQRVATFLKDLARTSAFKSVKSRSNACAGVRKRYDAPRQPARRKGCPCTTRASGAGCDAVVRRLESSGRAHVPRLRVSGLRWGTPGTRFFPSPGLARERRGDAGAAM